MSKDEMKAIFDNLTMAAGRRAEQEWDQESSTTKEVDSIEIEAWAARPSTPMAVTDWAQAQWKDPELEAPWSGVLMIRRRVLHGLSSWKN